MIRDEKIIIGVDEAGRGALAGPLVVAAVAGLDSKLSFCRDSKLLTARQRFLMFDEIRRNAVAIGSGWVDAQTIDEVGMSQALKVAARQAFSSFSHYECEIIVDGPFNFTGSNRMTKTMVSADLYIKQVSAASIVAKVARDLYMTNVSVCFPGWDFSKHKGYGTLQHIKTLTLKTPPQITHLHRKSFKPLRDALYN